jgi:hypothetical protein
MPIIARSRFFENYVPGGTWGSTTQTWKQSNGSCQDVVGDYGGLHSFDLDKTSRSPNPVNGYVTSGSTTQQLSGWVPLRFQNEGINHLAITRQYTDSSALTKTMASSNPNKPVVSLPVFLAELKDIPRTIFRLGDMLLNRGGLTTVDKAFASSYLGVSYGWAPLIGDLAKLFQFQDLVEKKIRELNRMHSNGGIRRKRVLQRDSTTLTDGPWAMNTAGGLGIYARCTRVTTYTEWCTVRWSLKPSSAPKPTDMDIRRQAENIVRGTTWQHDPWAIASDLWELTPWSWLTDWFTNVGDYLNAHRGYVPVQASRGCVMKHTHTVGAFSRTSGNATTTGGDGTIERHTKLRRVVSTTPLVEAGIPFLTGHQLSILGSLALTRG